MQFASYWIKKLGLLPHPEGGYYRETYRAVEKINDDRSVCTAIYFLLESKQFSAFHRIQSDEMWHFYLGSSLTVHYFDLQNKLQSICLGPHPDKGEVFQAVVPARCWFASEVTEPNSFALVGCTVSPGFDFKDFELARREELSRQFPAHHAMISRLTH